jgi:hypothetical protein
MEPKRAQNKEAVVDWFEDFVLDAPVPIDEAPKARLRSALGIKRRNGGSPLSLLKIDLDDAHCGSRVQHCLAYLLVPSAINDISDLNDLLMALIDSDDVDMVDTVDFGPEFVFPHRMILDDSSYERAAIADVRFRIIFRPEAGAADRMIIEAYWDNADIISTELSILNFDGEDLQVQHPDFHCEEVRMA